MAGILVAYFVDFSDSACQTIRYATIISYIFTLLCSFIKAYKWRIIPTVIIYASFFFIGITLTNSHFHRDLPQNLIEGCSDWVVRVAEEPSLKEKSVKIIAETLQNTEKQQVRTRFLLYLEPSTAAQSLRYGDLLLVHAIPALIQPPQNPDAFDNQRYMRRRGIYYSCFVRENAWHCFGHAPANRLKSAAQDIRDYLTSNYMSIGMSGDELEILKAILLGDDDSLDPELKAAYSSAGVSHILCVSGMHVGVIFMIINFLLKPLDFFPLSRLLKATLIMAIIWLYAHITGLAPSVTRSATMFTFVAIGQQLRRNTNVFHSLFASMFILLAINPLLLFEVGFQLSYLAVAGIVLFQPRLSGLYSCRTRVGKYFWELLTVSVAAQLGTFPISIYYFAQFPNYFMLSNMSVILLSFAVIITGVTLLPASLIPVIAQLISRLLTLEIKLMNNIITFIEQLPGAVTENIDYRFPQVILLYGTIIYLCLWLYRKHKRQLWLASVCLTLFCTSFAVKRWLDCQKTEFFAYHIRKNSVMEFNYHGKAVLFSDTLLCDEDKLYQYNIRNHARRHHRQTEIVSLDTTQFERPFLCKRGDFIRFEGKNYYILSGKQQLTGCRSKNDWSIDCLLLRKNPRMEPSKMMALMPFREVVADGTNTPFHIERWRVFCEENHIPFTYTGERKID